MYVLSLLRLEWRKVAPYTLFRVLLIFYAVLLPASYMVGKAITINMNNNMVSGALDAYYTFPKVWQGLGYVGSWMTFLFFGYMAAQLFTNEVQFRTLRQNLLTGMTRSDWWLSKMLMLLCLSVAASLYYGLCGTLIGLSYTDVVFASRFTEGFYYMAVFALQCFGYAVMAFTFGTLFRSGGLAVFLYFIYVLFLEIIVRWLIHGRIFGYSKAMHYYPANSLADLFPFQGGESTMPGGNFAIYLPQQEAIAAAIFFTTLLLALSWYRLQKADW